MRLAKIEKFTKKYKNMYKIQITWFDDKTHDPKICFFLFFDFELYLTLKRVYTSRS